MNLELRVITYLFYLCVLLNSDKAELGGANILSCHKIPKRFWMVAFKTFLERSTISTILKKLDGCLKSLNSPYPL
jgi:hypothetical protein